MAVYVERIELGNYRSCKKTRFSLDKCLTALIGANGSGKSNILQGLLLLNKVARASSAHLGDAVSLLGCKLRVWFNVDGKTIQYETLIKYLTDERNMDIVVDAAEKWNFKPITGNDTWIKIPLSAFTYQVQYLNFGLRRGEPKSKRRRGTRGSPFIRPFVSREVPGSEKIFPILDKIASFSSRINYYAASQFTDPSSCPTSFEIEEEKLSRRGAQTSEHLSFMYDLYSAYKRNRPEFDEFISLVGKEGMGLVSRIVFKETVATSNTVQVMAGGKAISKVIRTNLVIPNFIVHGSRLSPNQLSEGTFRTLAVLFYIITDKSLLLLLEEPEVCIHHGLLASLMSIIKTFSNRKQIVISTHSDFVLDMLEPTNVVIVRDDAQKGTIAKSVHASMSKREYAALRQYLETTGNLGEFWRYGELEKQ